MKKKNVIRMCVGVGILLVFVIILIAVFASKNISRYDVTEEAANTAYNLLYNDEINKLNKKETYYDFMRANSSDIEYDTNCSYYATMLNNQSSETYGYTGAGTVSVLGYEDDVTYSINVETAGYYRIYVNRYILGNPLTGFTMKVETKAPEGEFVHQFEESKAIDIPMIWKDSSKSFTLDKYGDETVPLGEKVIEWAVLDMYDTKHTTTEPLIFYFPAGNNEIKVTMLSSNGSLVLGDLWISAPEKVKNYNSYIANYTNFTISEEKKVDINAIDYIQKNSSYVRMANLDSSLALPYDVVSKKLNIIAGDSWNKSGQMITYEFTVDTTGLYDLSLHYKNDKSEYDVFRTIYIDSLIPFSEFSSYSFPYTDGAYANHTLADGNGVPYKVYLTEGTHTLQIKAAIDPIVEEMTRLQVVTNHINALALQVTKITGQKIDENRTLNLEEKMPLVKDYLLAYDTLLKNSVNNLSAYSANGANSATLSGINRAIAMLPLLLEKPNDLPIYLDRLYSGTSSINQLVGENLNDIAYQPLELEHCYVTTKNANLPNPNADFFSSVATTVVQLWNTFFSDKYNQTLKDNELNVWVTGRAITYLDIMQRMVDEAYSDSEKKVNLSLVSDTSKITMSVAAGNTPDVIVGLPSYMPYDLALRGGVYDLTQFEDFWEIADRFAPGLFLCYMLSDEDGDRIYAIPETLDFNALVYRTDIFESFNISHNINTWDDLLGILPELQRYGMNFYLPISANNGTKWYYQSTPLLLQSGGTIYSPDGLTVDLNNAKMIDAFERLTGLFTKRSLPTGVTVFYEHFRNGTMPIGVMDLATYLLLKNAAAELSGKWKMAMPIGTKTGFVDTNNDGEQQITEEDIVNRTYVGSGSSCSILKNTTKLDESWEFLKWWSSEEVQTDFAYTLQSTYGPEYVWLSSNVEAVKNSQFDEEDKQIILQAIEWIQEIPRNPGQYMVERCISNIWTNTVLQNKVLRVEIGSEVATMNREILRKMKEFKYVDAEGNVLKEYYVRDVAWLKAKIRAELGDDV